MKQEIRQNIRTIRKELSEERRLQLGLQAQKKLLSLPEYQSAHTIMLYAPFQGEIDTLFLLDNALQQGKTVSLPRTLFTEKKIVPIRIYNKDEIIFERSVPQPLGEEEIVKSSIQLAVIPGIAFDLLGYRIGYGGGFYDRFLTDFSGVSIGICFDFQLCHKPLPRSSLDIPVHTIITNEEIIRIK
jgi:5-formyltetrahydrofolate cyclo-ligase